MSLTKRQKTAKTVNSDKFKGSVLVNDTIIFEGHSSTILTNKFNIDGTIIASGGNDKSLKLWNTPTKEAIIDQLPTNFSSLAGHKSAITSIDWNSFNESILLTGSADHSLGVWDIYKSQRLRKLQHGQIVNEVSNFQEDLMISIGDDGGLKIWDIRTKSVVKEVMTDYPLFSVKTLGNFIYFTGLEPTINFLDFRNLSDLVKIETLHQDSITSLSIANQTLMTRSNDCTIRGIDLLTKEIKPILIETNNNNDNLLVKSKIFSRNNQDFLIFGNNDQLKIYDFGKQFQLGEFFGHNGQIIDIDIHPFENILLSGSTDGNLIIREV